VIKHIFFGIYVYLLLLNSLFYYTTKYGLLFFYFQIKREIFYLNFSISSPSTIVKPNLKFSNNIFSLVGTKTKHSIPYI